MEKEEEENIWRRKIFRQQKRRSNIDKFVEPLSWKASYVNLFLQRSYFVTKAEFRQKVFLERLCTVDTPSSTHHHRHHPESFYR